MCVGCDEGEYAPFYHDMSNFTNKHNIKLSTI